MVFGTSAGVIVPWVLLGVLSIGILAYAIYRIGNRPKGYAEIKANLRASEAQILRYHAELTARTLALKEAERKASAAKVKLLEAQHSDKLKALGAKERQEYEDAKADPQSGVDRMRKLLGLDS